MIAVMRGGSVEFRNSDVTMHNIHTMPVVMGNETIDVSQGPKGAPQVKPFLQPEVMMPVRCNNHPWMNAFINVSATPFFAVTDASGKFEIKGLPAGTYTLAVVHEKMGEQTIDGDGGPEGNGGGGLYLFDEVEGRGRWQVWRCCRLWSGASDLTLVSYRLPFWFLVFALFLPRVALAVAWLQGVLIPFHLQGIIPLLFGILLPRVLVLFLIYLDQGLSLWFVIHLVVALLVWGGGGHQIRRRRVDS